MGIFGLGDSGKTAAKKTAKKSTKKAGQASSSKSEAQAILAKMKAKKDSGDCAFC